MSNETDLRISKDWLEKLIKEDFINCYEYSDFKNVRRIGKGAFGRVYRADYHDTIFALKTFADYKSTIKEVVNEV